MLIDRYGNILPGYVMVNGIIIDDGDFEVALDYEDSNSVECKKRIKELKRMLERTDYKAIKFSDGALSEEEYAPIRKQRQEWRDEINKLEPHIIPPTITREELDKAEEIAMKKLSKAK